LKLKYDELQIKHDESVARFNDEKKIILEKYEKLNENHNKLSMQYEKALASCNDIASEFVVFKVLHEHCTPPSDSIIIPTPTQIDRVYDDLKWMNARIDDLSTTLSNCSHATKKLETIVYKKNKMNKNNSKNTHYAHLYTRTQKCVTCGQKGHVAKFCKNIHMRVQNPTTHKNAHPSKSHSHAPVSHSYDVVYNCTICGRSGHLAKFCYDAKRMSFVKKNGLKNASKTSLVFGSKNRLSVPFHSHTTSTHSFHCSHCGRDGHLKMFCFDRLKAINASKWVHNPKALEFTFRGNVPSSFGPKKFWVPK
jgi:hypothetical protein